MLPTVIKTSAIALTALSLGLGAAAPAQAFGANERNFLYGVGATLLVGAITRDARRNRAAPVYVQPQVVQPTVVVPTTYGYSSSSIYSTPAAQAFNAYSSSQRHAIQQRLASYGYYHSSIDGTFGPNTYNAVTAYAASTNRSSTLGTMAGAFGFYDALIY
ncbi:MAG: peptidoglycan-binding domain-containing protein [Pseudorhodobacter sp.]|nr:peptidoglycan-binding domain-containing protein [Pseudorhodobacter sp.]